MYSATFRPRKSISIHAPRKGERPYTNSSMTCLAYFNPRSPQGGATEIYSHLSAQREISIHAPRKGERPLSHGCAVEPFSISIHAPRKGERPTRIMLSNPVPPVFQSTLPARGSDFLKTRAAANKQYFNPRSPQGGATKNLSGKPATTKISIHAPRKGERQRKSAFVCSISANLLNIIHCGTVTRAVSRRRIALFRLFSVRRSGVFMYAYASH